MTRSQEFRRLATKVPRFVRLSSKLTLREITECLAFIDKYNYLDYKNFDEKLKSFPNDRSVKTININEMMEIISASNLISEGIN